MLFILVSNCPLSSLLLSAIIALRGEGGGGGNFCCLEEAKLFNEGCSFLHTKVMF